MGKDPAFLFYSSDFLTGTMFFSDEQTGKYIRLLCAQHQSGHLEEEDMIKICKTYDKDIFKKFMKDADGKYYNHRLEQETNKRIAYSESRRKNRSTKKEDMSNICDSYDEHMENENENENINEKEIEKGVKGEKKERKRRAKTAEIVKSFYGSQNNVALTAEELERLRLKFPEDADDAVEYLSQYIAEKGYRSVSHNLAIQRWVIDTVKERRLKRQGGRKASAYDEIMSLVREGDVK
jgi:uncharacterized protein YdaU (DUF1376 family)